MPEENNEKIEEQDEPLKVIEPEPINVDTIEHTKSSNIDDDLGNQLTKAQKDLLIGASYGVYTAGDIEVIVNNVISSSNTTSYVKVKEIRIDMPGALRIKFDMKPEEGGDDPGQITAYARIYKNGAAVGSIQSSADYSQWLTKSEDISNWEAGDYVQIYVKTTQSPYTGYVKKLEISCDSYADAMKKPLVALAASSGGAIWIAESTAYLRNATTIYAKVSEIQVNKTGDYNVSFSLKSGDVSKYADGRVYVNGVATGTERTNNTVDYTDYVEEMSLTEGDLVSVYIKSATIDDDSYSSNLKIGINADEDYATIIT